MEPKEVKFTLRIVYQGPDYEDPNPPEEDETAKKKPAGKTAAVEEPKIRMITPEPIPLENEHGRVFALELGQHCRFLLDEKQEEAAQLREQGQEIPDEFYETKWVRFYSDQRFLPKQGCLSSGGTSAMQEGTATAEARPTLSNSGEETKNAASRSKLEPVYPQRHEDMIVKVQSQAGLIEVGELTYRLNDEFRAGSYTLICKDVTPGLPPRMQMPHTKILMKFVDLDPPPEEEQKVDPKAKGKKR